MANFIRTKTKAHGGITAREKELMAGHAKLWISRAMRTDPIEPDKIIPAIEGIYAAANLKKPRIVIVPSPLVMAFAYGASAAIWYARKTGKSAATYAATRAATRAATATVVGDCAGGRVRTTPAVRRRATAVLTVGTGARLRWDLCLHLLRAGARAGAAGVGCDPCEGVAVSLKTPAQIEQMRPVGRLVADVLTSLRRAPGDVPRRRHRRRRR